ncbi:MAG: hypothetical protein HY515_05025 [Candidatus Aenigmarchaeota archaeon]|nr:hypothetical protein [Candidatus Aenigmarchaeota archaeon]
MRSFETLDEIRFGAKRIRISDEACVIRYTPLHNYRSVWSKKPNEEKITKTIRRAYAKTKWNSNIGRPNARWCDDEARRTETGWEIRYGFGVAYYMRD